MAGDLVNGAWGSERRSMRRSLVPPRALVGAACLLLTSLAGGAPQAQAAPDAAPVCRFTCLRIVASDPVTKGAGATKAVPAAGAYVYLFWAPDAGGAMRHHVGSPLICDASGVARPLVSSVQPERFKFAAGATYYFYLSGTFLIPDQVLDLCKPPASRLQRMETRSGARHVAMGVTETLSEIIDGAPGFQVRTTSSFPCWIATLQDFEERARSAGASACDVLTLVRRVFYPGSDWDEVLPSRCNKKPVDYDHESGRIRGTAYGVPVDLIERLGYDHRRTPGESVGQFGAYVLARGATTGLPERTRNATHYHLVRDGRALQSGHVLVGLEMYFAPPSRSWAQHVGIRRNPAVTWSGDLGQSVCRYNGIRTGHSAGDASAAWASARTLSTAEELLGDVVGTAVGHEASAAGTLASLEWTRPASRVLEDFLYDPRWRAKALDGFRAGNAFGPGSPSSTSVIDRKTIKADAFAFARAWCARQDATLLLEGSDAVKDGLERAVNDLLELCKGLRTP